MAEPNFAKIAFDPTDVTEKIDFTRPINTSSLKDLSILITGGANGLGALLSTQLAQHGAIITIADIAAEAGEKLASEINSKGFQATFIQTDVTSWDAQLRAFKAAIHASPHRSIDVVIPCAATQGFPIPISKTVSLDEDPVPPSSNTIDIALIGVYYTALLALHYFRLPGKSRNVEFRKQLLFIGSVGAYLELPPMADYTAAKFGVRGLWKTIRRDFTGLGMRTNLIAPTFLPTQMIRAVVPALEAKGARVGSLDDAVSAAIRLITDEKIDGRAIVVGGYGNFDIRDDYEGLDGGIETLEYFKKGGFGGGMHTLKEILGGR
ncbi:MAG: hypothetical protein M1820_000081 [Bogoriella megaspora]|nr:MAG: hypothetical protein M1820_000081 [Bogoriella megaspora]